MEQRMVRMEKITSEHTRLLADLKAGLTRLENILLEMKQLMVQTGKEKVSSEEGESSIKIAGKNGDETNKDDSSGMRLQSTEEAIQAVEKQFPELNLEDGVEGGEEAIAGLKAHPKEEALKVYSRRK